MIASALALLLGASAAARPGAENLRLLRDGTWNQRIHAATSLGALGPGALPLLVYAAGDADWQVRMTAVHEMGRVGRSALGALEDVLRSEPCRHVRLTAVHWLGSMGPEASDALRRALGDESAMVRLMGGYWLKKEAGESTASDGAEASKAGGEDLKACASSPQAGRAPWAEERAEAAAPGAEPPPLDEKVVTRDPVIAAAPAAPAKAAPPAAPILSQERLQELDELLTTSIPYAATAAYASTGRAPAPAHSVKRPKDPATPELMPPGAPGFGERPAPATSGADIMADAGIGKLASDALPALLAYMKDADPAKRARAADELGRRGGPEALAALTGALKDRAPRVRASAALALGNLGAAADASVPALVAALKKGPEEVTWSAAIALGRVGTPRARRAFARHSRESAGELARFPRPPKP